MMCGLTAISIGKKYSREELNRVKHIFTLTLLAHEERGGEATGVSIIWPDGSYRMLKQPVRATEFIASTEYSEFLRQWDGNVCTILGHTRKPTKGSVWNEHNNHPVTVDHIMGIHNGTIKNDDFLFEKEKLTRKAEVDSEIIFSLLSTISGVKNKNNLVSQIRGCTEKLSGSFTTISVDLKNPRELLLLKYNQPLSFHHSKSLNTLFFTSRYIFLRKAFGRAVITEALPSKRGYLFNLRSKSQGGGQPVREFSIASNGHLFTAQPPG